MKHTCTGMKTLKKHAESTRKQLLKAHLLDTKLKPIKNSDHIIFPLKHTRLNQHHYHGTLVTTQFHIRPKKTHSYKELIHLPQHLEHNLPTSYDIIGDILLIKIPQALQEHERNIGEALLQSHSHIKTVCKIHPVSGEYRTRTIKHLAGKQNTHTIHKEYGLKILVDVEKTYFSPRLANERKRITQLVKPGETILDMFTGVAPFSIMIAKHAHPHIIYSIDNNPKAIALAQKNITTNNVLDKITLIHSNIQDLNHPIDKNIDRIIMNLPFSAYQFFPLALTYATKPCAIHYYDILPENKIPEKITKLKNLAEQYHAILTSFTVTKIKTYASHEFYIALDITAKKNNTADVA